TDPSPTGTSTLSLHDALPILNAQYRRMLDREQEPSKDVRNYVKERYASALQLIKNIEQRKQTILKVCQSIIRRQTDFLESGIDRSEEHTSELQSRGHLVCRLL